MGYMQIIVHYVLTALLHNRLRRERSSSCSATLVYLETLTQKVLHNYGLSNFMIDRMV
jgi:hypothetical protein